MKKNWRRVLSTIIILSLALIMASCGPAAADPAEEGPDATPAPGAAAKTIRAGIGLNEQHPQYQGLLRFKEIVEERTDGEILVETYHSGQLGDDRSMMEALQLGA